jgi:putative FmdB family regulatory protein
MPVYVYKNLATGETFEVEQSIREDAWTEHPESGDPVKRIVQPVGIAFKGSGFYVNDSKKTSGGAAPKAAASDAATKGDAGGGTDAGSGAGTSGTASGDGSAGTAPDAGTSGTSGTSGAAAKKD